MLISNRFMEHAGCLTKSPSNSTFILAHLDSWIIKKGMFNKHNLFCLEIFNQVKKSLNLLSKEVGSLRDKKKRKWLPNSFNIK